MCLGAIMPVEFIMILIMLCAMFVQGAVGFGSALIAMPVLIGLVGTNMAAPLFALIAQTAGIAQLLYYRQHFHVRGLWRLFVASLCGIPLGILLVRAIDQQLALALLGVVMIAYSLYSLFTPSVPALRDSRWGFVFGFASGILHGAYNTGGPPLVIYGNAKRWPSAEFKTNLQTLFFINGLIVIATHAVNGHYTNEVFRYYALLVIPVIAGLILGQQMDRWIAPATFRRAVLVLLIVLGLTLIF
jgi:uncharacterized membrane protein YfcA